ncbi:MAG TPA: HD domain-containing phosphohydrolase [Vicinamibacterales bacterium]|jgi:putative nucleotidyltransferase with HDIG domain|nr:HD domain-containing phosphohydrolase [Vicinamibacterales bacterium]
MKHAERLPMWGRVYVATVVALGAVTILVSAYQLNVRPIGWNWFVLALLTLLSGLATVTLPSVAATISVSETFVFTSVLLFGPAAGTLTVTLDVLAISLWLARRKDPNYRIAFNVFALPAALWVGAQVFYILSRVQPLALSDAPVQISSLLFPLVAFTVTYFGLNSWLIAIAIWFETKQSPFKIWKNNFAILSLNYFGGASVAALLVTYTRNLDYTYIAFVLPLLAVLYFTFSTAMGRVKDANRHLSELNSLYMSTIETLAMAIDAKDQITHGHIRRVQMYAVGLAKHLGVSDSEQISAIEAASLLHDMGKLAVPEYILNKPGPLTAAEFEKMKMHASIGADILSAITFPYPVVPIVRHHHENWNGTGYPDGLVGADIPIGARILSVVDCFDALTSDRPYRPRLTDKDAIKILLERRGTMYDPLVVDTFIRVHHQITPSTELTSTSRSLRAIADSSSSLRLSEAAGRSLDEISAGSDETLTLFDLARTLRPNLSTDDIAESAIQHVRRLVPFSLCILYLLDVDSDELLSAYATGAQAALVSDIRIPRGHRLSGWVAANRQTIRNSDPVLDFGESARAMSPRLHSSLSTAVVANGELVGVLTFYSIPKDAFRTDHERVVEHVARQIAEPLRAARTRSQETMREQSSRSADIPFLDLSFTNARTAVVSNPGALLLIDVDRIHEPQLDQDFTSSFEHVVHRVRAMLRPMDMLYRYGARSLVVILPSMTDRSAEALQNRLLMALSAGRDGDPTSHVRITAATNPPDGRSIADLLEVASRRSPRSSEFTADDHNGLIH